MAPPDPLKTQLDPRYATGYCAACHEYRQLIRAHSVAEAVAGYKKLVEERERKKAEVDKLTGRNQL